MKIMLCCRACAKHHIGGMELVFDTRADELERHGHEVFRVTADDGRYTDVYAAKCVAEAKRVCPDILHLDSFDADRAWWVERPGNPRLIACTLHGHQWAAVMSRWALYVNRLGDDTGWSWSGLRDSCEKARTFNVLISISRYEQHMSRQWGNRFDTKLVYNPIRRQFFDSPVAAAKREGFVASGARWPDLADAAGKIAARDVRVFRGVKPMDMPAVYDGAVAFLLPTFWAQGFDLTVAEALARRCPVICYGVGSYLMEERPGMVKVPMNDPAAMAEAMLKPLPAVPEGAAADFHPEAHVRNWLEAIQ